MPNIIENNAYRILGLNANVRQNEILKRYKEITNRLKIDDHPKYEFDIGLPESQRTEITVKDAWQKLQSVKDNIKEYFFWFSVNSNDDKKAIAEIASDKLPKALEIWKDASNNENASSYLHKKNLGVLYILLISREKDAKYLKPSILLWKEILNSDKFWDTFLKSYSELNDNTPDLEQLKESIKKEISDIYIDLGHTNKNSDYIKNAQEAFGTFGEKTEKNVLKPIYNELYENINQLKNIVISKDGDPISEEIGNEKLIEIYDVIENIQKNLRKLQKSGLYNNSESKVVRDSVAQAIRAKVIELHNSAGLYKEAEDLIKIASKISGTNSYRSTLESDEGIIQKSIDTDSNILLSIKIPKFLSNPNFVEFRPRFVEYLDTKIFYSDVTQITFWGQRDNYGGGTFWGTIASDKYTISFTTSNLDSWGKAFGLAQQVMGPFIVKKYLSRIFEKNESISIGNVQFDKKGYSWPKFWGGTDSVNWTDRVYEPRFSQGFVRLFKDKDGVGRQCTTINMNTPNAGILPMLVKECYLRTHPTGIGTFAANKQRQNVNTAISFSSQPQNSTENAKNPTPDSSAVKYFIIKNKKTGKWDICTDNAHNPPLDRYIWAGDFKSEEEAKRYLKETLDKIRINMG